MDICVYPLTKFQSSFSPGSVSFLSPIRPPCFVPGGDNLRSRSGILPPSPGGDNFCSRRGTFPPSPGGDNFFSRSGPLISSPGGECICCLNGPLVSTDLPWDGSEDEAVFGGGPGGPRFFGSFSAPVERAFAGGGPGGPRFRGAFFVPKETAAAPDGGPGGPLLTPVLGGFPAPFDIELVASIPMPFLALIISMKASILVRICSTSSWL